MEKREKIEHLAGSRDEEILLARVYDRMTAAQQRNIPAGGRTSPAAADAYQPGGSFFRTVMCRSSTSR